MISETLKLHIEGISEEVASLRNRGLLPGHVVDNLLDAFIELACAIVSPDYPDNQITEEITEDRIK